MKKGALFTAKKGFKNEIRSEILANSDKKQLSRSYI